MDTNGHTILCEDYVSYEVAKLLKEKGFDEPCRSYYIGSSGRYSRCAVEIRTINCASDEILRPTHQMVLKWLREEHNIMVEVYLPYEYEHEEERWDGKYCFELFSLINGHSMFWDETEYNTYEEAVKAAIKYTLENLI